MPKISMTKSHLFPLDVFYLMEKRPLPSAEIITSDQLPHKAKQLLDHGNDMTPTLEAWHHTKLTLRVLDSHRRHHEFYRKVVLLPKEGGKPVEFGAITINLSLFNSQVQSQILSCRVPLGTILNESSIAHCGQLQGFLKVEADSTIRRALDTRSAKPLYGRKNVLLNGDGIPLAEVLELLPPIVR